MRKELDNINEMENMECVEATEKKVGFFGKIGHAIWDNKKEIAVGAVMTVLGFGAGYKFGRDSVVTAVADVVESTAEVVEEVVDTVNF